MQTPGNLVRFNRDFLDRFSPTTVIGFSEDSITDRGIGQHGCASGKAALCSALEPDRPLSETRFGPLA